MAWHRRPVSPGSDEDPGPILVCAAGQLLAECDDRVVPALVRR